MCEYSEDAPDQLPSPDLLRLSLTEDRPGHREPYAFLHSYLYISERSNGCTPRRPLKTV